MRGKIPVTEEQFFDSVDSWIWELTGEGSHYSCGFCKAKDEANRKSRVNLGCSECLAFELCFPSGSPYYKSRFPDSEEDYKQAVMEVLEGLYEIGVKLGFYTIKPVSERAKSWYANLSDLPDDWKSEVVKEIDKQESEVE
jgi:hypothetical protein